MSEKLIEAKNLISTLLAFRNNDSRCPVELRSSSDLCTFLSHVLSEGYYMLSPGLRKSIPAYLVEEFQCKCMGEEYWTYDRVCGLISNGLPSEGPRKRRQREGDESEAEE